MTASPVLKACACLVDANGRLLVFHHPEDKGMQLPKGTIEHGEAPEDAVRRELQEESGIHFTGELDNGAPMEFDAVDVFDLDGDGRIVKLSSWYDSHAVRKTLRAALADGRAAA